MKNVQKKLRNNNEILPKNVLEVIITNYFLLTLLIKDNYKEFQVINLQNFVWNLGKITETWMFSNITQKGGNNDRFFEGNYV